MKTKLNPVLAVIGLASGLAFFAQPLMANEIYFSDTMQSGFDNWVVNGDNIFTKDTFAPLSWVSFDYMSLSWTGAGADYFFGVSPYTGPGYGGYVDNLYRGDGEWHHFEFQISDVYYDFHLAFTEAPGEGFVRNVVVSQTAPDTGLGGFGLMTMSAAGLAWFGQRSLALKRKS